MEPFSSFAPLPSFTLQTHRRRDVKRLRLLDTPHLTSFSHRPTPSRLLSLDLRPLVNACVARRNGARDCRRKSRLVRSVVAQATDYMPRAMVIATNLSANAIITIAPVVVRRERVTTSVFGAVQTSIDSFCNVQSTFILIILISIPHVALFVALPIHQYILYYINFFSIGIQSYSVSPSLS